jgi:hypothetical protein
LNITIADRSLNGSLQQRANQISANAYGGSSSPSGVYLLKSSFENPALGTLGNLGRNAVDGPRTFAFDMSVSRSFKVRESLGFEVRGEAFNVTNSFRPGNPNTTFTSAVFGQIRSTATGDLDAPRIMQFSLKFTF